uniref:Uncharacterized protein n=1 Tax=Amphimedon queenslandica TaxID=400682 RepID=A0A1X7TWH6_AMPQE
MSNASTSSSHGHRLSSPPWRVTLRRNGHRNELLLSQVNTENIKRMFQVDVQEVYLKNDLTDQSFFPDDNGYFSALTDVVYDNYAELIVVGPKSTDSPARPHTHRNSTSMTTTSTAPRMPPSFRSVVNPPSTTAKKLPTFSLRIITARM